MAVTHSIDGNTIASVRIESVELVEMAETGNIGQGSLTIDDAAGVISTVGHKDYRGYESDCVSPLLVAGQLGARTIRRGTNKTGGGRVIAATIKDLNELAARRVIVGSDSRRPAETVGSRLAWILASDYLSDLVVDSGFVDYPSTLMDKNDYKNSRPGDVIGDCSLAANGRNWFVYPDEYEWTPSLWFRDSNTSTDYTSDLRFSTVLSDIDWDTTFPVNQDASLERDPEQVFSGVSVPFARGTKYETKPSTAAAFVARDGVAPTSSIKTAARASRLGRRFLNDHDEETDSFNMQAIVPSSRVNLIRAGMRTSSRFEFVGPEGYSSFTWFRVLERRIAHIISPGGIPEAPDEPLYLLTLRLSPQSEAAPACPYETTESQTFYPLGDLASEDGLFHANPSDGFVYYLRPGLFYPTTPTPGAESYWHFNAYGSGGPATTDYAGDCVQNTLQFIVVGAGTLSVQTEVYAPSGSRPMSGGWFDSTGWHSIGTLTSGDVAEFVIEEECVSVIRLFDGPGSPCGGKWGWSSADWVAA